VPRTVLSGRAGADDDDVVVPLHGSSLAAAGLVRETAR
jgi:hypothetical protein